MRKIGKQRLLKQYANKFLIYFFSVIWISGYSQKTDTRLSISLGYPTNLSNDTKELLNDSMMLKKQFSYSYLASIEIIHTNKWCFGVGSVMNNFDYRNDDIKVSLNQYIGYFNIGYSWQITKKLSFKNNIFVGGSQLWQTLTLKSTQQDFWSSYKNNDQNIYYSKSGVSFIMGYNSSLCYRIGKNVFCTVNLFYSFNHDRQKQIINNNPVFKNVLTPSIGFVFRFKRNSFEEVNSGNLPERLEPIR